jgi:O-antigen ligase
LKPALSISDLLGRVHVVWPSIEENNRWYTRLYFAASALIGSVSSVFLHVAMVWAVVKLALGRFPLTRSRPVWVVAIAFSAYPAAELVSVLVNQRGSVGMLEWLGQIAFLAILPVYSRLSLNTAEDVMTSTADGAAVGGVIALIFSLLQIYGFDGIDRAEAGYGNASILATIAVLMACLSIMGAGLSKGRRRFVYVMGAVAALGALALSGMRSVWLITPVVLLISGIFAFRSGFKMPAARWIVLFIALALIVGVFAAPMVEARLEALFRGVDRMMNGEVRDRSFADRLLLWRAAVPLVMAQPWFGYGPDSVPTIIAMLPADRALTHTHFHNFAINTLVRGGVFDLAALLLMPLAMIAVAWRPKPLPVQNAGRLILFILSIIYFVPGLFGILFDHDIMNAFFVYGTIIGLTLLTRPVSDPIET